MTYSYVIITPVRDEEEHLACTIDSVLSQTIRPSRWVIVDDGSVDRTGEIAAAAAKSYQWITAVNRCDRGFRQAGGGVIRAFYAGYRLVELEPWDFLVKMDGDLSFAPDYFARCIEAMAQDPTLGITGGTIARKTPAGLEPEAKGDPVFHVRGATKIYRRDCWDAIGGLITAPGWDTLDEVKANMLGWKSATLAGINALHLRPTGGAYGTWNDRVKAGRANYISGYHPLFMLAKCAKRLLQKPLLVGSTALLYGFITGYLKRLPQVDDPALIRYFRQQQINRLLGRRSLWG